MRLKAISIAIAVSVGIALAPAVAEAKIGHGSAIDGDTIRLNNGKSVRVIGIDSPEEGRCGSGKATKATDRFIRHGFTLVNAKGENRDRYGRLLRSVRNPNGKDLGAFLIRRGLAVARYDSRDGYGWHAQESKYHRLDARQRNVCGFDPTNDRKPGTGGGGTKPNGTAYANCDAARRAGVTPIYRGEPGYSSSLDRDGDGVACE